MLLDFFVVVPDLTTFLRLLQIYINHNGNRSLWYILNVCMFISMAKALMCLFWLIVIS